MEAEVEEEEGGGGSKSGSKRSQRHNPEKDKGILGGGVQ